MVEVGMLAIATMAARLIVVDVDQPKAMRVERIRVRFSAVPIIGIAGYFLKLVFFFMK